jgi:hypothetical protein
VLFHQNYPFVLLLSLSPSFVPQFSVVSRIPLPFACRAVAFGETFAAVGHEDRIAYRICRPHGFKQCIVCASVGRFALIWRIGFL